jgi:hypothetical protein
VLEVAGWRRGAREDGRLRPPAADGGGRRPPPLTTYLAAAARADTLVKARIGPAVLTATIAASVSIWRAWAQALDWRKRSAQGIAA